MTIQQVIEQIETWAPPSYQEGYDNAGLICGEASAPVKGVVVCLDSTEEVVKEAIELGANLIVAHHPIVFKGLKQLTGKSYVERTLLKAIKNDIAIYAAHTNLDSVLTGVNAKIGELLGIKSPSILAPKSNTLEKLVTYCPTQEVSKVQSALFKAGAGKIGNYDSCSFNSTGTGTFRGLEGSNAYVGTKHELHQEQETKIEVILDKHLRSRIINALINSHPYEEVAYEIYPILNSNNYVGSGMVGNLSEAINLNDFFDDLKSKFKLSIIRHTGTINQQVKRIAWCGGAGSFLLPHAKRAKADVFITGDFKYHEFFDHENEIVITDIGHYESEQFTSELIVDFLTGNFDTFAVHLSRVNTNPVNYY